MVTGVIAVGALISAGAGYASYQSGKKEAKTKKNEINRLRGVETEKRMSLIRSQRNQLGKGRSGVNTTSPTGLTSQVKKEEVLG